MDELLHSAQTRSFLLADFATLESLTLKSIKFLQDPPAVSDVVFADLMELHLHLCLLTGRDAEAKVALQQLVDRFGLEGYRIGVLKALNHAAIKGYGSLDSIETTSPSYNLRGLRKIRMVHLKTSGKLQQYIQSLVHFLNDLPDDQEAWAELAEAYAHSGNYDLAIRSLEQVLVLSPYAYPVFARAGECYHQLALSLAGGAARGLSNLEKAVQHFARSVELCPTYLRGWAGLYVSAVKLDQLDRKAKLGDLVERAETALRADKALCDRLGL